ncbi:hypothetical protein ACFVVL_26520 [Kitasatospora sp. NPDC058115]|uniref:hypothetical protein n=1 Tax=Kitasatospora sp. NPDC058115 TaxID=3346347 RepID=UPI0036DE0DA0
MPPPRPPAGAAPSRSAPRRSAPGWLPGTARTSPPWPAGQGGARLGGPGLAAPLATAEGKGSYLRRLFEQADLRFESGQVAFGRSMTYVEWHGTAVPAWSRDPVTGKGTEVSFGIVERFGPGGTWELFFDTLPLIADEGGIAALYGRLARP